MFNAYDVELNPQDSEEIEIFSRLVECDGMHMSSQKPYTVTICNELDESAIVMIINNNFDDYPDMIASRGINDLYKNARLKGVPFSEKCKLVRRHKLMWTTGWMKRIRPNVTSSLVMENMHTQLQTYSGHELHTVFLNSLMEHDLQMYIQFKIDIKEAVSVAELGRLVESILLDIGNYVPSIIMRSFDIIGSVLPHVDYPCDIQEISSALQAYYTDDRLPHPIDVSLQTKMFLLYTLGHNFYANSVANKLVTDPWIMFDTDEMPKCALEIMKG